MKNKAACCNYWTIWPNNTVLFRLISILFTSSSSKKTPNSDVPSTSSSVWLFIASLFSRVHQLQLFCHDLCISVKPCRKEAGQNGTSQILHLSLCLASFARHISYRYFSEIRDALSKTCNAKEKTTCPLRFGSDPALQLLLSVAKPIWRLTSAADGKPCQGSCSRKFLASPFPCSLSCTLAPEQPQRWGVGPGQLLWGGGWSFFVKTKLKGALRNAGISSPCARAKSWKVSQGHNQKQYRVLWMKAWCMASFYEYPCSSEKSSEILIRGSNSFQEEMELLCFLIFASFELTSVTQRQWALL